MGNLIEIKRHDAIAEVGLNRPNAYNSFNLDLLTQLAENLTKLAGDDSIRGIVLTGRGKAFSAGGDLKWIVNAAEAAGPAFHILAGQFHTAVLEIRRMKKPVIAAINGIAAGGGFSLALACDFRVMAKSATMKLAYTSAGLCIDGSGSFTLPRIVGMAKAMEIASFDKPITAEQALSWGLVTQLAEDNQALDDAIEMMKSLVSRSIHALGWCKKLFTDAYHTPFEAHIEMERQGLASCGNHPDGQEGLKAFVEKRQPVFI